MLGIGIDTGGTCTDAVIFDHKSRRVLSWAKALTTKNDLKIGILEAMRGLDGELLKKAEYIALSTTLATNACVEDKGGRAKLVFIGVNPRAVTMMKGVYGLPDTGEIYFLDCTIDISDREIVPPDWDRFREDVRRDFQGYDAVAVVQMNPQLNGGSFEAEAEKIITEETGALCVRGYDLFQEVNVQKRGASALLNARLMPLVMEFFDSIEASMKEMGLDLNIYVMKSDGTVMSKDYAMRRPVETLLCGPAASVRGAMELTGAEEGFVIDMGGTTSDVALIRNGRPMASDGVKVGRWQTMVKGVDIDTFALGGDTGVLLANNDIVLDKRRVIPISVLAHEYPQVIKGLEDIIRKFYSFPLTDGLYVLLIKKPADLTGYSEKEQQVIELLENGPLSYIQLGEKMGISHHFLDLKRLENQGIIMRSGVTPTDAMHLKGDYTEYSVEAAELGIRYLALQTRMSRDEVAQKIYDLVIFRLYKNLLHLELKYEMGDRYAEEDEATVEKLAMEVMRRFRDDEPQRFIDVRTVSGYKLIGVGAPTAVFIGDTASLLETDKSVSELSGVANAVGAAAGDIITEYTAVIRVSKTGDYLLSGGEELVVCGSYDVALEAAKDLALRKAEEKARMQTGEGTLKTDVEVKEDFFRLPAGDRVLVETRVTASAQIML
ncbi:MAG: hydantoinase/oxoprolinase family protein [Firmicutes bacterium]|nr:hydantoinase/oxoprolinase family protein [Bacillota bacterium]